MDDKYTGLIGNIREVGGGNLQWKAASHAMAAMATFLAELAEDAKEQSNANLAIQRRLVNQTWLIFWLTLGMFLLSAVQLGCHQIR